MALVQTSFVAFPAVIALIGVTICVADGLKPKRNLPPVTFINVQVAQIFILLFLSFNFFTVFNFLITSSVLFFYICYHRGVRSCSDARLDESNLFVFFSLKSFFRKKYALLVFESIDCRLTGCFVSFLLFTL